MATSSDIDALIARLRDSGILITAECSNIEKLMLEAAAALAALKAERDEWQRVADNALAALKIAESNAQQIDALKADAERSRAQTIEECARVCDGVQTDIAWRKIDAQYGEACKECARAIRSLLASEKD